MGTTTAKASSGSWRGRIAQLYDQLSPSYKALARFLIERPTEAAFMNGLEAAAHLDLDPATMVRFAQMLNYPGYPELLAQVRADVRETLGLAEEARAPVPGTPAAHWQTALHESACAIQSIVDGAAWKDVRRFVQNLRSARAVVVVAEAGDRLQAEWLASTLRLAGLRAAALEATPRAEDPLAAALGKGDVVLGLALGSSGTAVAEAVRAARGRNARVMTIVGGDGVRPGLTGEVTLPCPTSAGHAGFFALVEGLRRALIGPDPIGADG